MKLPSIFSIHRNVNWTLFFRSQCASALIFIAGACISGTGVTAQDIPDKSESNSQNAQIPHRAKWEAAATPEGLEAGRRIYNTICLTCHGDLTREGSLPTSRPFWKAPFQKGGDPYSMFQTVTEGFNQMPPQPWLTPTQAYQVIHYVREVLVRPNNPDAYFNVTEAYLKQLPEGDTETVELTQAQKEFAEGPKYLRMNFGPALHWTLQVEPGNIAYKGIAIRLDKGDGGVSRGKAWALFDHDTMRMATFWEGSDFVNWRGIAFDQSHGTHTSIVGSKTATLPVGPGWANPETGSWEDNRLVGRDGLRYGPLEAAWAKYKGSYRYQDRTLLEYTLGDTRILESPDLIDLTETPSPIYRRDFWVGASDQALKLRLGNETTEAALIGDHPEISLEREEGFLVLQINPRQSPVEFGVCLTEGPAVSLLIPSNTLDVVQGMDQWKTQGGPSLWNQVVETEWLPYHEGSGFETLELEIPFENPWSSWMRLGGFDFYEGGDRAAVATWLGDVWLVDGISSTDQPLKWKRIATGLFQPLGVKVVNGEIFVTCRDQLARLHDLNGDEEIDHIECFNNDHQVTEHFHEFAMGLQVGPDGSFYYAKSARHAKKALVPHHGTLIRVSPDGSSSEIIANGFRAANGVCLNEDGSFFVTDQEGHWTPKNRINWVRPGKFYGNWMGYHELEDSSDEGMESPMVWITNAKDRSPGELVWIPKNEKWGSLAGRLINLSYGTGRIFIAPHENRNGILQGGVTELPIPAFPTGVMRGRFHPETSDLYACGMFAWAGNRQRDGGFYKIRPVGKMSPLPVELKFRPGRIGINWSAGLDVELLKNHPIRKVTAWDLRRSGSYGSPHLNEKDWEVTSWHVSDDQRTLLMEVPEIAETRGMAFQVPVGSDENHEVRWVDVHATVNRLD